MEKKGSIEGLVLGIILRQLAAMYFLAAPVLCYFAVTSFPFAAGNVSLFVALKRLGRAEEKTTAWAVAPAYRFPAIHGWTVMACWVIVSDPFILTPFIRRGTITTAEIIAVVVLTVLTGIVSSSLVSLIAEIGRASFFELPEVRRHQLSAAPLVARFKVDSSKDAAA